MSRCMYTPRLPARLKWLWYWGQPLITDVPESSLTKHETMYDKMGAVFPVGAFQATLSDGVQVLDAAAATLEGLRVGRES